MSDGSIFVPIDARQIEEELEPISLVYDLVAVTLVNGDVLLGGIFERFERNHVRVALSFNTSEGKRFGFSRAIFIPVGSIADIAIVPLDDSSLPKLAPDDPQTQTLRTILGETFSETGLIDHIDKVPVHHYPNPIASIICDHNVHVASQWGWTVAGCGEKALAQDAIPPEGIRFRNDCLLYADWEFFRQQAPGSITVTGGVSAQVIYAEISMDVSKSLREQVLRQLEGPSLVEKARGLVSPIPEKHIIQGCFLEREPRETTEIEGETWYLWMVVKSDGETCPVLLKYQALRYPQEFIGRVNSVLTFYGELMELPIRVLDKEYARTLLTRAIGYFHGIESKLVG